MILFGCMSEAAIPVICWRVFTVVHDTIEVDLVNFSIRIQLAQAENFPLSSIPVLCAVLLYADMELLEQFSL